MELKSTVLRLAKTERSFCSQIAKIKFLKDSDKGKKFFHELIKSNRSRSQIVFVSLSDGSRSTSFHQVSNAFLDFIRIFLALVLPILSWIILIFWIVNK